MDYKATFSERLKEERKAKKLSQDEMAIQIDISRPSYTLYENGKNTPTFENLIKIANILKISLDYLCGLSNIKENRTNNYYDDMWDL